ncbi:MAG TPA: iron uptake transporter deferrochelatase/peroxidase subunit [Acidimicrobiales bacterium]
MSPERPRSVSRRQMLAGSGLATAALVAAAGAGRAGADTPTAGTGANEPFRGAHQSGIATPEQARLAFATFDVTSTDRAGLKDLLASWTVAAERMTGGHAVDGPTGPFAPPADTGEALDLPAARLTLTVGFGPSLFDGRFGLADRRPAALVDLPAFPGDALDPTMTGGDVCIQACADDPQVAFHAIHNLARIGLGAVTLRYLQLGFGRAASSGQGGPTPRNLLGFKDGTDNIESSNAGAMDTVVWVGGSSSPMWMHGGTYLVARRIRIHLEAWDRSTLGDQECTIGRSKTSGAPLGEAHEHDPVDLTALDSFGEPRIPDGAHIRVAAPSTNHGSALLRRGYSFADGVDPTTGELDAGLFFICFQKDPANQFVPIQRRLAGQDALTTYLSHTGSGVFACPPGPGPDHPWGHDLF